MKRFLGPWPQKKARGMVSVDRSKFFLRELKRVGERVPFLNLLAAQASWLATLPLQLTTSARSRWERARMRWRESGPNEDLTLGEWLTGRGFADKLSEYGGIGAEKSLLEVGPGYGRLIGTILEMSLPFQRYLGVDISLKNVEWLEANYRSAHVHFRLADAETDSLGGFFNTAFCSLTMQHFYPTFERVLLNIRRHLLPGCLLVFDILEARRLWPRGFFEPYASWKSYVRTYTKAEVVRILQVTGFGLVAFDTVLHGANCRRLLVVARCASPRVGDDA